MVTGHSLTEQGLQLQRDINDRISLYYDDWSPYEVGYQVEKICEELAPNWEFRMLHSIGRRPSVVLTQYRP